MRPQDLTVEVRNRELKRLGQVLPRDLSLTARLRWCGVGEWTLTLPGDHEMVPYLQEPGSGLLVTSRATGTPEVLFSGPTLSPTRKRDQKNPSGTLTFSGVTDEVLLEDALAFPDPQGSADPTAQGKANDVRTGTTESLLRQYVAYNVTHDQALPGRVRGFRQYVDLKGSSLSRGITQSKSPRFQNLLELLQEIATTDGQLGFRMYQEGDLILFEVLEVRDLRRLIRLDVESGTLNSEETVAAGAGLTDALVAGQGEGEARTIVRVQNVDAETDWMRPIERFFDRRDTDDPLELQQKGEEELNAAAGGLAAKVVPSDDQTMQYLKDWRQGDWLTVVVNGQERDSVVTEAVIKMDSSAAMVGIAVGDVSTFDPRDVQAKKQESIDSRVAYLERATNRPALSATGAEVTDWNQATENGSYWGNNATNRPPGTSGMLMVHVLRDGSGRIVQEAPDPTDLMNRRWRRVYSSGAWGTWKLVGAGGLPDPERYQGGGIQAITATAWADMPGGAEVSFDIPQAMLVQISFAGWMTATAGETRVGVAMTGATVANNPFPGWGSVLYVSASDTVGTVQRSASFTARLEAGATTIKVRGYQSSGGTHQWNYGTLDVAPLRWL